MSVWQLESQVDDREWLHKALEIRKSYLFLSSECILLNNFCSVDAHFETLSKHITIAVLPYF
jgi:hypothetical protein